MQTPRNKGKSSGRAPQTSTKTTFTTELASEQGTSSQQQEGDKDLGDKNTREDSNNQQREHTGGNDQDDSGSDSSSNSGSSSASSVKSILRLRTNNQRGQRAKSVEQEQWESTTCISFPPGQKKLSKQLKGIKLEAPENLDISERKCTHSQYLDEWVNAVQHWLVIEGIDLDSAEALEVVGFKLKGSALTTYNHFRRDC